MTSAKTLFPKKVTVTDIGVTVTNNADIGLQHIFWGGTIHPTTLPLVQTCKNGGDTIFTPDT